MAVQHQTALVQCNQGNKVRILAIKIDGPLRRRLLDLGFVPGAIIDVLQKSPLGDPVAYRVCQTTIALRKEESEKIFVEIVEGNET